MKELRTQINLDDYELYVAPENASDKKHPALAVVVEIDVVENSTRMFTKVKKLVAADTCLLRSPYMMAIRHKNGNSSATSYQLRYSIFPKSLLKGYLSDDSANYRSDLFKLFERLAPRKPVIDRSDLFKISLEKAQLNSCYVPGLYPLAVMKTFSYIDHACIPSCMIVFDAVLREVTVWSVRNLGANELVTVSYIPFPIDDAKKRKALLRDVGFECKCQACETDQYPSLAYLRYTEFFTSKFCWWCGDRAKTKCVCGARFCSDYCKEKDYPIHSHVCDHVRLNLKPNGAPLKSKKIF